MRFRSGVGGVVTRALLIGAVLIAVSAVPGSASASAAAYPVIYDGALGYGPNAPYERIIATVGA